MSQHSLEFAALQEITTGRFVVERTIGRGATGMVFLAQDLTLDRAVAIKVLNAEFTNDTDQRERFVQEARTAARLSHPNVVPIHSVHEEGDSVFFVMGYVDGETLGARVEAAGPLPFPSARRMMQEVAWALGYAHARGVVHRDIKPDNILLERLTGRALVTDFGIARVRDTTEVSESGTLVGTPLYMSPEQAAGHEVDTRSDIYSLGATTFYALTGRPPFEADNIGELLYKRIHERPPALGSLRPELPRSFTSLVDRCLETQPDNRLDNAETIADRLDELRVVGRDIPRPVQEFQRMSDRVAHRLMVLVPVGGVLVYALSTIRDLGAEHTVLLLWVIWILIAEVIVEPLGLIMAARRLQQSGITYETFREALRWQAEAELTAPLRSIATPVRSRLLVGIVAAIAAAAALATTFLTSALPVSSRVSLWSFGVASALFAIVSLGSVFITEWGTGESSPVLRHNAWAGSFGRWFFLVARLRLNVGSRLGYQSRRPTEAILAESITAIIHDLPREARNKLRGVRMRTAQLVERARQLRGHGLVQISEDEDLQGHLVELERMRQGLTRVQDGKMSVESFVEEMRGEAEK